MIYLDHAATSYPKSPAVIRAVAQAMQYYGANPGRGGYPMALAASEQLYRFREKAASLFGVRDPAQVVFTLNCTQSLNIVIKSLLYGGGRAVVSDLEHNAVMRPLHAVIPHGIDVAHVTVGDDEATVAAFQRAITPSTKAVICTHASNVLGVALPIRRIAAVAHECGVPMVVDAAQSAGHLPIDIEADGVDYVCMAGHKGLGGPMGTGLLIGREQSPLRPLVQGGTGSYSASLEQPHEWPDRLESGTPNVAGLCGLYAALCALRPHGVAVEAPRELQLCNRLYNALSSVDGICLYSPQPLEGASTPVLSLRIDGVGVEETCEALAAHGVAVRGGLHCAPTAHRAIGTLPEGTVRLSVGPHNTAKQIDYTVQILEKIAKNPLCFRRGYDKIIDV